MTIQVITAQDAIHLNHASIPKGTQACGYDTGSSAIQWTSADYAAHTTPYPAIHIDQDPSATDALADILDVESGAATVAEIPGWITRARSNYSAKRRASQRWPGVYCAMGNLSAAVSALQKAGISSVPFWTAEPGNSLVYATQRIQSATGPYPCIGVQYAWGNTVDYDAFSQNWVSQMAGTITPPATSGTVYGYRRCLKCACIYWPTTVQACAAGGKHNPETTTSWGIPFRKP